MLTEPEVSLIGITRPLEGGTIEQHLERAARECYQSHKLMSPEDSPRFIRGIILRGHESVLEHTSATFRVLGGSRAFTHEQVRHRLLSFSQQSQRYVSETNYRAILPPAVADNPEALAVFQELLEHTREAYAKLKELGLRNEDARFVLPNAVESGIVISGNLREWRHVFRGAVGDSAHLLDDAQAGARACASGVRRFRPGRGDLGGAASGGDCRVR
jgi:thymidylate synthase (FAD)